MSGFGSYGQYNNGGGSNNYSYGGGGGQDYSYSNSGNAQQQQLGGGGDGWMNSGGFSNTNTEDNKSRGGYQNHTLRPVTIKQLNDISVTNVDLPVLLDGEEIRQITFVGVIRNILPQPVNIIYTIEDGTGKLDARHWFGNNNDLQGDGGADDNSAPVDPDLVTGKYVRVYGELKFFNGKRHVSLHRIRPVTDHNEITCHGLEVINAHLLKTRGAAPNASGGNASAGNPSAMPQSSMYSGINAGSTYGQGMGTNDFGLSAIQSAILQTIKSTSQNPKGIEIQNIVSALSSQYSKDQITNEIEWLISEGHLYNTTDEFHVQSTNLD